MKHLINYLEFFNKKIFNHNQNKPEINLEKKSVHHRRDLDSLGEYLNISDFQ